MDESKARLSVTPEQDAEYMEAVKAGDMETAQRMVDEVAKANGYERLLYHGAKKGGGFTKFKDWQYFTENRAYADRYAQRDNPGSLYTVYANLGNVFDTRKPDEKRIFENAIGELGLSQLQESGLPDWTDGYDLSDYIDENGLDYDSIILDEGGDLVDGKPVSRGLTYVIRKSNQFKSAEPVTYDDNGNVIPLSQRFNEDSNDIRFSIVGPKAAQTIASLGEPGMQMNLVVAKQMEADGKEKLVIKRATGWERGADGKWRYEIATGKLLDWDGSKVNLTQVWEDNSLFTAYPELKDFVISTRNLSKNIAGYTDDKEIVMNKSIIDDKERIRSFIAHEIQHDIQVIEGFAVGSNILVSKHKNESDAEKAVLLRHGITNGGTIFNSVYPDDVKQYIKVIEDRAGIDNSLSGSIPSIPIADNYKDWYNDSQYKTDRDAYDDWEKSVVEGNTPIVTPEALAEFESKVTPEQAAMVKKMFNRMLEWAQIEKEIEAEKKSGKYNKNYYHLAAGEVEARNEQARKDMSEEERRNSLLSDTEDVPREDQWINLMGGRSDEDNNDIRFRITMPEGSGKNAKSMAAYNEWKKSRVANILDRASIIPEENETQAEFIYRCCERLNALFPKGMPAKAIETSMPADALVDAIGVENNKKNRKHYYDALQKLTSNGERNVLGIRFTDFDGNGEIVALTERNITFDKTVLTYIHENMHHFFTTRRKAYESNGEGVSAFNDTIRGWYNVLCREYSNEYGEDKLKERLDALNKYTEQEKPEEFIIRYITECMVNVEDSNIIETGSYFSNFVNDFKESIGYEEDTTYSQGQEEVSGDSGQSIPGYGEAGSDNPGGWDESSLRRLDSKSSAAQQTADKLGVKIEIVGRDQMPEGHKWSMGVWYNGRILICPANNPSEDETVKTVLHEAVGHEGLRRLVGKNYVESFCMEIYKQLPEDIRKDIASNAVKHGNWNMSTAVEEWLAEKAQDFNMDETFHETFFDKVGNVLRSVLRRLGFDIPLSERDIRWILFQNYYALHNNLKTEANRARLAHRLGLSKSALQARADAQQKIMDRGIESTFSAASLYNTETSTLGARLHETITDQYDAVNRLVDAIEKSTGKKAQSFEDIKLALNQQSSKGYRDMQNWEKRYWKPLQEIIKTISSKTGHSVEEIERYMMLKHGVERNDVLAKRDAIAYYQALRDLKVEAIMKDETLDEEDRKYEIEKADNKLALQKAKVENGTDDLYQHNREQDYGGLTGIYSDYPNDLAPFNEKVESLEDYYKRVLSEREPMFEKVSEMEAEANKEVAAFEKEIGDELTNELWKRINNATKATLKHQYDNNMMSRSQYEHVRDMFQYYIPLRGFEDKTAGDLYSYYTTASGNQFQAPVMMARGRRSKAASPIGYIGAQASSGIAADMKNSSKLALWYFVNNRPNNDLVVISETWYRKKTDANGEVEKDASGRAIFEPVYPPFDESLNSDEAKENYRRWEEEMKALRASGLAFHGVRDMNKQGIRYVINQTKDQQKSHIITLKVAGSEKFMFINGNPRAAQAINNELNMDVEESFQRILGPINRFFSNINTSMNPEFWVSNFQRDILFALMSVDVKEDSKYKRAFHRNMKKALGTIKMNKAYENGTLGAGYIEDMYREFVENGGVTGYTRIVDNEKWEAEVRKFANDNKSFFEKIEGGFDAVKTSKVFESIARTSDGIEQITRFCAFLTSREQGRNIEQAIADAKEITINFNRKGSGKPITFEEAKKLRTRRGKPLNALEQLFAVAISRLNRYGRRNIIFWNASIQAINAVAQMIKANPKKITKWGVMMFALGAINAAIHAILDDDDDYLDIPDYERHNNLLIGGNGYYFKWALPQETRVLYGMGDMALTYMMGRYPHKDFVKESLGMISAISPLDFSEGWIGVVPIGAVPTYLRPVVEVLSNRDFKGSPVYKENKYMSDAEKKATPKWNNAYQSTGQVYVNISKILNYATGGDNVAAGKVNIHPEVIEHIVSGVTGGAGTTAARAYRSTVGGLLGLVPGKIGEDYGNDWTMRNAPMLSRLITVNDERYRNTYVNDLYWHYKGVNESINSLIKRYTKEGEVDKALELMNSEDYEAAQIFKSYKGVIDMYNNALKMTTDRNERKQLTKEQDAYKAEMLEYISNIGKDNKK